jgi:hypothetical protein
VVRHALADPATDEVIVIDDRDATVAIALELEQVIRSSVAVKDLPKFEMDMALMLVC